MTKRLATTIMLFASLGWACSSSSTDSGSINASGEASPTGGPPSTLERLIEEGDIVWLDDPILYILNKTKGLSVVGLGDPTAPLLIGRVGLQGDPVELYLHNGYILALTSGVWDSSQAISGSRLSIVDVHSPERPVTVSTLMLEGKTTNSRLVGDVLYAASDSGKVIQSVDLANPSDPRLVDRLSLPLGTYGSHVLVTQNVFYVATVSWDLAAMGECASSSYDREGCTTVMAVDISSPVGRMRRGASYAMVGTLKDRWCLDYYDGVLRVLVARSGTSSSNGRLSANLRTFVARSADEMDPLGWMGLAPERYENVKAVRFDGTRAYVVTFMKTDPLFTIDLSDPAHPSVAGSLQTPGWLDFIIPRGDRLLGVGRDQDTTSSVWRLQASIYDVSTTASPRLLGRTLFGDSYSALPDQADNMAKVVRVIDELGILLVPYNGTSVGYGSGSDGRLEVLSFANDKLSTLGTIASTAPILRAVPLPPMHVAAVTESAVGVIQVSSPLAVTGFLNL
jgi:hypothetical protein